MKDGAAYMKHAVLAWEGLRVVYTGALLAVAVLMPAQVREYMADQTALGYWGPMFACVAVANVFYCLGPLAESYAYAMAGWRMGWKRYVLFTIGLLCSVYYMGGTEVLRHGLGT